MKLLYSIFILACIFCLLPGCKKFLDRKPDKKLVVPSSISDLQALLDYNSRMNNNGSSLGDIASDDYYLTNSVWQSLPATDRNAYIWNADMYAAFPNDWSALYDVVYYANIVLEGLDKIERTALNYEQWDQVKGSALWYRAHSFLEAVWLWSKPFDPAAANSDLGIPLRLSSDFNQASVRASVQECYEQILNDLKNAISLLPVTPLHVMRPSKPAAFALLARTYLSMRQYETAGQYADSCLLLKNQLMDYNTLDPTADFPFPPFNSEVILHHSANFYRVNLYYDYATIDSVLAGLYADNDLRKILFFKEKNDGTKEFKGTYDPSMGYFNGIATDEVYLMKAECQARAGNKDEALSVLNQLMQTRWATNSFIPFTATTPEQALNLILAERRKELLYRNLRWMDIKRLNKEGAGIEIRRVVNGDQYILTPDDKRYALPIPANIITLTGMPQNPY